MWPSRSARRPDASSTVMPQIGSLAIALFAEPQIVASQITLLPSDVKEITLCFRKLDNLRTKLELLVGALQFIDVYEDTQIHNRMFSL